MTETTKDPHHRWVEEFADELRLRHVEETQVSDALGNVREHLTDSGQSPAAAFGNPREYAASLGLPSRDEGLGRAGSLAGVFTASASFLAFGFAVTRWIDGDNSSAVIIWTLGAAAVMLAASVWLTISIARHVVDTAVRERFTGTGAGLWGRWAPLAIAAPWVFTIFAAVFLAVSALRA